MSARRRPERSSSDRWMDLAVRYLARWDRTVAQVQQYLLQQGAPPVEVSRTISRLSDLRYLDDRSYAERWLERRIARQPMGRARLGAELQGRGIARTLAEEVIQDILRNVEEEDLARRALKRKQQKGRRPTPAQAVRLLREWGFDEETVHRIITVRHDHE